MDKNIKTVVEYSAGGVVISGDKVLVIKTKNLQGETVYAFPKGHIEQGESAAQAALREVFEETSVKCEVDKELKQIDYWFRQDDKRIHKFVKWFLMHPVEKDKISNTDKNIEVDEVLWVKLKDADKILSYESDRKTISEIVNNNSK